MLRTERAPMNRLETQTETVVELIAPDGLGFGEGGISVKEQVRTGILTQEVPGHVDKLLTDDPLAFKAVEVNDDGCGDGRPWTQVVQVVDGKIMQYNKSRLRAKVFGGGLVVASSMWRTIQGAPKPGEVALADRKFMADELAKREFSHGAHSSDHASDGDCGCGAIDNYPLITRNATKYRSEITGILKAIYGEEFADNHLAIEEAFEVYQSLTEDEEYFDGADGEASMEQILKSGAVIKELYGGHVEETIVINDVPGTTLDQQYFTQQVKAACVEDIKPQTVQAFSVDVWRGRDIADIVATVAAEQDPNCDIEHLRQLAYADFLIRTLAVAGTLTAGDLPVYRRRAA